MNKGKKLRCASCLQIVSTCRRTGCESTPEFRERILAKLTKERGGLPSEYWPAKKTKADVIGELKGQLLTCFDSITRLERQRDRLVSAISNVMTDDQLDTKPSALDGLTVRNFLKECK